MVRRGPTPNYRALLKVWDGKNREREFQLKEVRERSKQCCPELAKKTERTLIRYLHTLEKLNLLDKRVSGKTRLTFYSPSNKGIKEAIRQKSSSLLDSMPIDGAAEFEGSYHLPFSIEVNTEATRLKWLGRLDGAEALPRPELTYALYHHSGKDSQKKIERMLRFFSGVVLDRLVANIVMSSVNVLTGKDPDYIESMDELVDWYKDAIDQKFILMVVFDGKSVVEKIKRWSQVKEKAKNLQMKWRKERTDLMASEKIFETYRASLPKEIQTTIEARTAKRLLESLVTGAIRGASLKRFRSKDDAINAVVEESNAQSFEIDLIKHSTPQLLPLLTDTSKMKEIVTDYLSSKTARFVLRQEKYQYPESNRVYDVYVFRPVTK